MIIEEQHDSEVDVATDYLREQLRQCSAAFDRQQEQLDRNAEQIATLREQLAIAEQLRQKDVADAINKAVQIVEHQERAIEREGAAGLWRLVRCSDAIRALLKENGK